MKKKTTDIYAKGYYLYQFVDINDKILYIGQTDWLGKRISRNLNGNKHLNIPTVKWFSFYQLKEVRFLNVSDLIQEKAELEYLESLFITKYQPKINQREKDKNIFEIISKFYDRLDLEQLTRIESYFDNIEDTDFEYYDFNINKNYKALTSLNIVKIV